VVIPFNISCGHCFTHIKVPQDGPDERYVYLSDVLPTAWQAVEYADVPRAAR
jgi:threonine dehydrogenase-like Zn-dependent dehydrogenase